MFNEENTVEQLVLDTLCGGVTSNMAAEELACYGGEVKSWRFIPAEELPRQHSDVLVESIVRDALIRLNPEIKAQPDRADEVLYRLRTIPLSVQSEGLVRANELFDEWLRGEKSMPFGERGEHTPVRLIDLDDLSNNDYVVTSQWVYPVKEGGRRFDQGSGKSLLMVFAAQKLRMHRRLGNPTVMIVVDRIDLDTQITATFNAADIPNMIGASNRQEMQNLLAADTRKIIITTIHKFADAEGRLNERPNIIVMVDEAHRTQEGDLGRRMRAALPNAFLFGLTGTPINKRDLNTFWAFGADEDEHGYLSRYSFQDSIRDRATLPLHFEAVDVRLHINKEAIDEAYAQLTDRLNEEDRDELAKRAARMAVLVKAPERVNAICRHIVKHFQEKVEPNDFKAQVVAFDRECCVLYKKVMDELVGPEASAISTNSQRNCRS